MREILCWFGLHRWRSTGVTPVGWSYTCTRCGKARNTNEMPGG